MQVDHDTSDRRGDMFGHMGVDHLAEQGMIDMIIDSSPISGPSCAEPPLIWRLVEAIKVSEITKLTHSRPRS